VLVALLAGAGVYWYALKHVSPATNSVKSAETTNAPTEDPFDITTKPLKQLKGDEFKKLYAGVAYPNTQEISDPPAITGN